jgi:hypothetical protein
MKQEYPLETYIEDDEGPFYCDQYENWGHCKECEAEYLHLATHLICVGLSKAFKEGTR